MTAINPRRSNRGRACLSAARTALLLLALALPLLFSRAAGDGEVTVTIVGDVMLARGVASAMQKQGDAYPFARVRDILLSSDTAVANLECTLAQPGRQALDKPVVLRAPETAALALRQNGFDVVSLANNHSLDCQSLGLADTMDALRDAGVEYIGTDAYMPYVFEKNGVRVAFLAYSALPDESDAAGVNIAYARADALRELQAQVSEAASHSDLTVVYFHFGSEYRHNASQRQLLLAHSAADAGAGLVVGAHPHVLQGVEEYHGALIYYSLGNFIFDRQIYPDTDVSILLRVTVGKDGLRRADEIPIVIQKGQPRPAQGEEGERILQSLREYSERFTAPAQ